MFVGIFFAAAFQFALFSKYDMLQQTRVNTIAKMKS